MEGFIEERGNNPLEEFGMMGPHEKINDIYGSLLRPGNITVIVARSGVGKTQYCMDYSTKVSAKYDVPVLHFDNGEMSKEELIIRQCAALSGVPSYLLESGRWREAGAETVQKVRAVWQKVKNLQFYYYNVGGMDVDSMINTLKRFYYSTVGRGNKMIFSFDYIKTSSDSGGGNKNEWQLVGEMVDKFKKCIQKEILEDGNPVIPMITSVQSNRSGLRQKTNDEVVEEGPQFGTHKLINVKCRHLGKDIAGAIEPVQVDDNLRKNFINLAFKNFNITECGDLRDIVDFRNTGGNLVGSETSDIPSFEDL
jgi:replicative DNA helicase